MARQLLGKEVTAVMNEKIKSNVAKLQEKGSKKISLKPSILLQPWHHARTQAHSRCSLTVYETDKSRNECVLSVSTREIYVYCFQKLFDKFK